MVVHNDANMETRRSELGGSLLTPLPMLYVRNQLAPPQAAILERRDAWRLTVNGVMRPGTLTLAQLKAIGAYSVTMVLQCAGNGRGFFPGKLHGVPWTVGGAGCVTWVGVPVRVVVQALGGLAPGALFMTGTGGEDLPLGADAREHIFERSVPLAAMDDALLAWELNSEPIALAHGGPLRLVVPGYLGVNSVKYVRQLAFSAIESDARVMRTDYRLTPPGAKPGPTQPSTWEIPVNSWIHSPAPQRTPLKAGLCKVLGVAFGGAQALRQIDVSVDGGVSWQIAEFVGPDYGRFAWRQFAFETELPAGKHTLLSRATDVHGREQPRLRLDNLGGYNNNSWMDHGVTITVV
jgi:sulfite dehydrogenase